MKIKHLVLLVCAALSLSASGYCNDGQIEISCGECGDRGDRGDREKNHKTMLVSNDNDEAKNEQDAQNNQDKTILASNDNDEAKNEQDAQDHQDKTILVSNDEGSKENDSNENGAKLASCNCPPEMIENALQEKLNSQASEANLV